MDLAVNKTEQQIFCTCMATLKSKHTCIVEAWAYLHEFARYVGVGRYFTQWNIHEETRNSHAKVCGGRWPERDAFTLRLHRN